MACSFYTYMFLHCSMACSFYTYMFLHCSMACSFYTYKILYCSMLTKCIMVMFKFPPCSNLHALQFTSHSNHKPHATHSTNQGNRVRRQHKWKWLMGFIKDDKSLDFVGFLYIKLWCKTYARDRVVLVRQHNQQSSSSHSDTFMQLHAQRTCKRKFLYF